MHIFSTRISAVSNINSLKKEDILKILCSAVEFEEFETRDGEEGVLYDIADNSAQYSLAGLRREWLQPHNKTNLLL